MMNTQELLRIIDAIHREKNIDKEVVFQAIESALVSAAKKHYGENEEITVNINRQDGSITATHNGVASRPGRNRRSHRRPNRQASHHPKGARSRTRRAL
ncbi:MAG: NusA N-terminal domain-containing protein [Pirellulales bacterium]